MNSLFPAKPTISPPPSSFPHAVAPSAFPLSVHSVAFSPHLTLNFAPTVECFRAARRCSSPSSSSRSPPRLPCLFLSALLHHPNRQHLASPPLLLPSAPVRPRTLEQGFYCRSREINCRKLCESAKFLANICNKSNNTCAYWRNWAYMPFSILNII